MLMLGRRRRLMSGMVLCRRVAAHSERQDGE
jgi:hypothetical protein